MDKNTAIKIIESLANGVSPLTGEELPLDDTMQDVYVVRALFFALSRINAYRANNIASNARSGFTRSEREDTWQEYCEVVRNDNPYSYLEDFDEKGGDVEGIDEEYFEDSADYECDESYDEDYDHDEALDEVRKEIYESMESYARSEDAGWCYSNREGSWEDNISDEDAAY